jgi:hypothetical protein
MSLLLNVKILIFYVDALNVGITINLSKWIIPHATNYAIHTSIMFYPHVVCNKTMRQYPFS